MTQTQISSAYRLSSRSNPRSIDIAGDNDFTDLGLPENVPCLVSLAMLSSTGALLTSDIVVYLTIDNTSAGSGIPLMADGATHSGRYRVVVTRRAGATVYVNHHTSTATRINVLELR